MTTTDELRQLLDERGVEWRRAPHYSSKSVDNETIFAGNGIEWYAREYDDDYVELRTLRFLVTPSQAVDATVGRETCHPLVEWKRLSQQQEYRFWTCDCGEGLGKDERDSFFGTRRAKLPNYCPNCGARIEVDG